MTIFVKYNIFLIFMYIYIYLGCYVYLGALRRLLDLNIVIEKDTLYKLIEMCYNHEDHKNVIGYNILHSALASLKIDAIEFINWTKYNGHIPSSKLIEEAKKLQKKIDRRTRVASSSGRDSQKMRMRARRSTKVTRGSFGSKAQLTTLAELDEEEGADEREESIGEMGGRKHLNLRDIKGRNSIPSDDGSSMLDGFRLRTDSLRGSFDFEMGSRAGSMIWEDDMSDSGSEWGGSSDFGGMSDADNTNSKSTLNFNFSFSNFDLND